MRQDLRQEPDLREEPDPRQESDPREDIALHIRDLRAFAMSLARNHAAADDLVQDTIERAWRHSSSFTPGTNLRAWLCTILRNAYYSDLRKTRREVPDTDGAFVARLSVRPAHDGVLALGDFLVAFGRLSPEHREVLTLVGALGFSYDEAAEATTQAVGTVKSRVSRARKALQGILETGSYDRDGREAGDAMRSILADAERLSAIR